MLKSLFKKKVPVTLALILILLVSTIGVYAATNTAVGSSVDDYNTNPPQSLANMTVTAEGDIELCEKKYSHLDDWEDGKYQARDSWSATAPGFTNSTINDRINNNLNTVVPRPDWNNTVGTISVTSGQLVLNDGDNGEARTNSSKSTGTWVVKVDQSNDAAWRFRFLQEDDDSYLKFTDDDFNSDLKLVKNVNGSETTITSINQDLNGIYILRVTRNETGYVKVYIDGSLTLSADTSYSPAANYISTQVARNNGDVAVEEVYLYEKTSFSGSCTGPEHQVTNATEAWIHTKNVTNTSYTATWQAWTGSQWIQDNTTTYTNPGNFSMQLNESADKYRLNVTATNTTDTENKFELHDEGVKFLNHDPSLTDPRPTGTLTTSTPTLKVNVSDEEFGSAQGDTVTVDFYVDNAKVGSDTVSSEGVASYTTSSLTGGDHTWNATATDSYGSSTVNTSTQTISIPDTLYIRNELNASKLVNETNYGAGNATVHIRFYWKNKTVERTTSDGTINLTGLPITDFIVTIQVDGWIDRTAIVNDLTTQQNLYLLNKSTNALQTTFELKDYTTNFPPADTQIIINKSIEINGTFQWVTVSGDFFGATSKFPANLRYGDRYKIYIKNMETGESRYLGTYVPDVAREPTLEVSKKGGAISIEKAKLFTDIDPDIESLPNASAVNISFNIIHVTGNLSSYNFTVENETTTLKQYSGTDPGGEAKTLTLNLTNQTGNEINASISYETVDGDTGKVSKVFDVFRQGMNKYSLINVLNNFGGVLAVEDLRIVALVVSLMVTAAVGVMGMPTLGTGLTAILSLSMFAYIEWISYQILIAAVAVWITVEVARGGYLQ